MEIPKSGFVSIVGENGCGKSTVVAILMRRNRSYGGSVKIGGRKQSDIKEAKLMKTFITYIASKAICSKVRLFFRKL